MNCGCQYSNYGCQGGYGYNPFGCGGCNMMMGNGCGYGGCGGTNWFAIVLVVFLLLIICGNSRIRP